MMTYLRVQWRHAAEDEPCWLYSELDERRMERRKIDIYPDGRWGFADEHQEVGCSGLSEACTPTVVELNADPEYEASEITSEEFEQMWAARSSAQVWTPWPIDDKRDRAS